MKLSESLYNVCVLRIDTTEDNVTGKQKKCKIWYLWYFYKEQVYEVNEDS